MIYDCFTFFNELDLLEIRLNILNEVVDKFVLVEATRTFRGNPKPLYFAENKERFAPFLDKIIHIVVDSYEPGEKYIAPKDSDPTLHSWAYENFQRHSIIRGLGKLKDEDTLIVSDLDEIPSAEAVREATHLTKDGKVRRISISHRCYFLNFKNFAMPYFEWGPVVLSGKVFRDVKTYGKVRKDDLSIRQVLSPPSPQLVRAMNPDALIRAGGWHFSFIGGVDKIRHKLQNYSHTEFSSDAFTDPKRLNEIIENGGDVFGLNDRFYAIPPEKCLPPYILKNLDRFGHYLHATDNSYLKRTFLPKIKASIFFRLRMITPCWIKGFIYRRIS